MNKNVLICSLKIKLDNLDKRNKEMSRICEITGKRLQRGNNVSHSHRKTKKAFMPNLHWKKFYLEEEDRWVTLKVSAAAIRSISKNGLKATLDKAVKNGNLIAY